MAAKTVGELTHRAICLLILSISNASSPDDVSSETTLVSLASEAPGKSYRRLRATDIRWREKLRFPPAHVDNVLRHQVSIIDASLNCVANRQVVSNSILFGRSKSCSHLIIIGVVLHAFALDLEMCPGGVYCKPLGPNQWERANLRMMLVSRKSLLSALTAVQHGATFFFSLTLFVPWPRFGQKGLVLSQS